MKNTLKKISAIAMAFALLGTGKAVTKTISPQSDIALTAHALSWGDDDFSTPQGGWWPIALNCKHNSGTTRGWSKWYVVDHIGPNDETKVRYRVERCKRCNAILSFDFNDYDTKICLY